MKKIFLIRHGQSEWNKLYKIQGQQDTMLTDLGRKQAVRIGSRLINENVDIIFTSDLARAFDTANIISGIINKPLVVSQDIREINFGKWEGLTLQNIKEMYRDEYSLWLKEPDRLEIEGAETLKKLEARIMNWINNIIMESRENNIAIVSHSATLKTIILGLLGIDISHYKNITLHNVSLSIVECREYNNVLTMLNDTSHLKELL